MTSTGAGASAPPPGDPGLAVRVLLRFPPPPTTVPDTTVVTSSRRRRATTTSGRSTRGPVVTTGVSGR